MKTSREVFTEKQMLMVAIVECPKPGFLEPVADFLSRCSIGPAKRGDVAVVWERDLTAHSLPNGTQGLLINRDGLVISSHADPTPATASGAAGSRCA